MQLLLTVSCSTLRCMGRSPLAEVLFFVQEQVCSLEGGLVQRSESVWP